MKVKIIKEPKGYEYLILDIITGTFHITPFKSVMCKFIGMHATSLYRQSKKNPGFAQKFTYRNFVVTKAMKINGKSTEQ